MAAVAARAGAVRKEVTATHRGRPRRVRTRRRHKTSILRLSRIGLPILAFVLLFGYVNVYACLTATSYNRDELMAHWRLEKIRNERLKVELSARSSPANVVDAAQKAGMVYATQYDYLGQPEKMARAAADR